MNIRDGNPLDILVIAASSERRSFLATLTGRAAPARINTHSSVSLERIFQTAPDVVTVEIDNPEMLRPVTRAAEALPKGTGLIVLADTPEPSWVRVALRAGVNAILSREITVEEMRLAIQAAEAGLVLLHPSSIADLGGHIREPVFPPLLEGLTAREHEVLRLVSEGLGNKEIATRLHISDHTVKFHISSVMGKLGAGSRTEAVSQGIRRGLITI